MRRLPDWPERLANLLRTTAILPFAWGRRDCCTFAADAVLAVTGVDPLQGLRGAWADRRSAVQVLRSLGGLRDAVTQRLGQPMPWPACAWRGDIVLVRQGGKPALAVCAGADCVGPAAQGAVRVPMTQALAAWSVGHG